MSYRIFVMVAVVCLVFVSCCGIFTMASCFVSTAMAMATCWAIMMLVTATVQQVELEVVGILSAGAATGIV